MKNFFLFALAVIMCFAVAIGFFHISLVKNYNNYQIIKKYSR